VEFLEPLPPEDLQAYERSMQEWLKGAEVVAGARIRQSVSFSAKE